MNRVPLGELIVKAKSPRAGDRKYPLLSMTMRDGLVDQSHKFKKRVASNDLSAYKVIRRGQLVVGFPIDEAVLDFQTTYPEGIVSPAYGVWDLRDDDISDRDFLKRYLRSSTAIAYYKAKLRGSTARRRSLPEPDFLAHPVPLPPIGEQRRIAAILDHADALRAKRRQVLAHLDTLTQSIFHEMFGEPQVRRPLGSLGVDFSTGKNVVGIGTNTHPARRVLKVSAISGGTFDPSEAKPLPLDYAAPTKHRVQLGDVLFGRASGSLDLLGAVSVVDVDPGETYLPDKIWRLELAEAPDVLPQFVVGVLRSADFRRFVVHNASGAAGVRNVGKRTVLSFNAPMATPDLQHEFARRIKSVNAARGAVLEALAAADELFASLQSRAFRGEL